MAVNTFYNFHAALRTTSPGASKKACREACGRLSIRGNETGSVLDEELDHQSMVVMPEIAPE